MKATTKNSSVACNALYKARESFNCHLVPTEAWTLVQMLVRQIVEAEKVDGAAVHLWSIGPSNERLSCGLHRARKGPRRMQKPKPTIIIQEESTL